MNRGTRLMRFMYINVRFASSTTIKPAARGKTVLEEGNIFATFTALCNEHKAMNLGQGFPSFGAPPFLSTILSEVCKGDQFSESGPVNLNNQYCKPGEEPQLSLTLARMYGERFKRVLGPSNVCTFVGAQEGIFTTMATFCNPGDEVVVITPCFDAYFKSASVFGLDVKGVPLTINNTETKFPSAAEFKIDSELLRNTLTQKTRLLVLNTPSSPLGKVFSLEEMQEIAEVVQAFPNLVVLSDEVYEHMIFDGKQHFNIAKCDGMWERTISLYSVGKTFSCTGWRIGYAIGPSELLDSVKVLHSVINFATTTPLQKATSLAFSYAEKANYFEWLKHLLQGKRDLLCRALNRMGISYVHPEGGYFVVADMSPHYELAGITKDEISSVTPSTHMDQRPDVRFAKWLIKEVGVGGIPMSPFYTPEHRHLANNYIRFAYCKDTATLTTAIERLEKRFR